MSGSDLFAWVHYCGSTDLGVHLRSLEFTNARLEVGWIIGVRFGSFRRASTSPCSFEFAWVHTGHPCGRRINFEYTWFPRARLAFGFGFARVRLGVIGFIRVGVGSLGWA